MNTVKSKVTSYFICHCGNGQNNHNFRHTFEKMVRVKYKYKTKNNVTYKVFQLNANDFPKLLGQEGCTVPQCGKNEAYHEDKHIKHKYQPGKKFIYKHIKFVIPPDTVCRIPGCGVNIIDHEEVLTHPFTTKVVIINKNKRDKVTIEHPDDDELPIIWEKIEKGKWDNLWKNKNNDLINA